jgi:MFS family permease
MSTPATTPPSSPRVSAPNLPASARLRPDPPLWPFLLALSCVAGLAELAFIIVNVSALPVFLEFGLGLPKLVGYTLGIFYLAEALGNSPMGALGDKFGRRRLMVTGALVSVGTCIATAFVRVPEGGGPLAWGGIGLLLLLRVLDGLGAAALWPALFASVSDRVPDNKQAQAMSALNITYFVGIALGPFVGGYVNDTWGQGLKASDPARYVPSFFVAAACFALAALIAYFVAPRQAAPAPPPPVDHGAEVLGEAGPAAAHDTHGEAASLAGVRRALQLVPALMALGFLTFLAIGLIAPYVKLFAMKRFDISESAFGTLLLYPALLIAAAAVPMGHVTDRWGKSRSIWAEWPCAP